MTTSRLLLIAGIGLGVLALIILIAALGSREEEVAPLPREVRSAPVAPSQTPDRDFPVAGEEPTQSAPTAVVRVRPEPQETDRIAEDPEAGPVSRAPGIADSVTDAAPPPITFCFPEVIPGRADCASREEVLALAGKAVGVMREDGAEPLTVEMVHPSDKGTPSKTVSNCADYLRLKSQDWGALTSAGMATSLKLNRFCGLIVMAERAERATSGGLTSLTEASLSTVRPGNWPSIGEAVLEDPVISRDQQDARVWQIEGESVTLRLREVAAADFDDDRAAEVLLHSAVVARGGTARGGGYLLAEESEEGITLTPASIF